jgi:hypothetical protein
VDCRTKKMAAEIIERNDLSSNRHPALFVGWSMISGECFPPVPRENRYPHANLKRDGD